MIFKMLGLCKMKVLPAHICRRYSIELVQGKIVTGDSNDYSFKDKLFTDRQPKYPAVVFDKDGTLICFHSMWTPWVKNLVNNINKDLQKDLSSLMFNILGFSAKTLKTQPGLMAEGTKDQIKEALKRVICAECNLTDMEALHIVEKHFINNATNEKSLREISNIRKLFKVMKQYGIKIGICTSDTREGTLSTLSALDARHLVDHICCGDDADCLPKPNPHNASIFAKKFIVTTSQIVMVGDTKTDMEFGKNSGMGSNIGVLSGIGDTDDLKAGGANHIIHSVEDILPYLLPEAPIHLTQYTEKILSHNWKLIIMDKDGTLTDLHSRYRKWTLLLGERLSQATSEEVKEKFFDIVGFEDDQTFASGSVMLELAVHKMNEIIRYLLILEGYTANEADKILHKVWVDTSVFGEEEVTDFKETLIALKAKGIKLALNSNDFRTSVINFIKRNNIDDIFDYVLSADDVSPNFKPLPNSIQKICEDLQIGFEDTLVIGDSQSDLLSAKAAKVGASVGVLSGIGKPQNLMKLCHVLLPNINYLTHLIQRRTMHTFRNSCLNDVRSMSTAASAVSKRFYDYIIVGGGSAGCVLGNRLSADKNNSVLLLEAGPAGNTWTIDMPAALTFNLCHDKYNWFYSTVPQKHLNNREMYWPRGRVLGGSSALNAMVYIRGHPLDYDRWEKEGATGWSYASCLPYFKKAQNHEFGGNLYRGSDGPLHVTRGKTEHPLHTMWINAAVAAGYSYTDDMNGYKQEGFGQMDLTIHNGMRWRTSEAYLKPISDRKNIQVDTNVLVTKIIFDGKKAIGLEVLNKRKELEKIMVNKEIILCGGAINSPQLLMLSGVGNTSDLLKHDIKVVEHVPGVGQNLQDHLEVYIQHECKEPITLYKCQWKFPHKMVSVGLQWFLFKTGLGASGHLESGGFIRSEKNVAHPDIEYHFLPSTVVDHGRKMATCHSFQAHVGTMRSQSKGTIVLKSANPKEHPIIDPNYNSLERDFWEFRQCIRLTREIFAQSVFDKVRGREIQPGNDVITDSQIDNFVRAKSDTAYHPSCTCKMGSTTDNDTVVDPECRVVGLENIRVVDASIMPSIVSGNLNAPVIMLAEKAADIILGHKPLNKMLNVPVWTPRFPDRQREMDNV